MKSARSRGPVSGVFRSGRAVYRSFVGDEADYSVTYRAYALSGVWIRETLGATPENVENGGAFLYFFLGQSRCVGEDGRDAELPEPGNGDEVILRPGTERERTLRVAEVCRYPDSILAPHVRIRLK